MLVAYYVDYLPEKNRSSTLPLPDEGMTLTDSLSILNLHTGNVVDLCMPQSSTFNDFPIWSPDSRYIITTVTGHADGGTYRGKVYVVDLENLTVFPVAENVIPVGWMNK